MDEFGYLTERYGLKPQGKSAPMASSKRPDEPANVRTGNSVSNSFSNAKSAYHSSSDNGFFFNDDETLFVSNQKAQNFKGLDDVNDGFDIFGGFQKNSTKNGNGSSLNHDPFFSNSNYSGAKSSFDGDILRGFNRSNSNHNHTDDFFGSFVSKPNHNAPVDDLLGDFTATSKPPSQNGSVGFDDLLSGFGNGSSNSSYKRENLGMNESIWTSAGDPFIGLEATSTTKKSTSTEPLAEFSKLKPPPRPGQVLKSSKVTSSSDSLIDGLEEFGMVKERNNADRRAELHHAKESRQTAKPSKFKEAEDASQKNHQTSEYDVASFFGMGARSNSAPKSRAATSDTILDTKINSRGESAVAQKKSSSTSSGIRKVSSTTSMVDDFPSLFGDASFFGEFEEVKGESEERRRARMGRHQRTQDRIAQAVADMNQRDLQSQNEQEEKRRLADKVDSNIKRWSEGREGNLRALLSTLQDVLWPGCGWEPVSLADLIASTAVKKVYRKATLCVHPDKVQQKGATLEQKYTAEKVFDMLKECWKKFEKQELS